MGEMAGRWRRGCGDGVWQILWEKWQGGEGEGVVLGVWKILWVEREMAEVKERVWQIL